MREVVFGCCGIYLVDRAGGIGREVNERAEGGLYNGRDLPIRNLRVKNDSTVRTSIKISSIHLPWAVSPS